MSLSQRSTCSLKNDREVLRVQFMGELAEQRKRPFFPFPNTNLNQISEKLDEIEIELYKRKHVRKRSDKSGSPHTPRYK